MTARPTPRRDAGMVTAETAVLLPVLVVVLATAVFVLACVAAQLTCVDAARRPRASPPAGSQLRRSPGPPSASLGRRPGRGQRR